MSRNIQDRQLVITRAFPAANANVDSASFDLGQATPTLAGEKHELEIDVPALPNLADTKTATITIQDSADDSSFAAIAGLATFVFTGVSTSGAAAAIRKVRLPSNVRRYVRVNIAVAADGGNNTAASATLRIRS